MSAAEHWCGGCQCGAVRYEILAQPVNPYLCHCRMCQKHFGSPFAALVDVDKKDFKLLRGEIAYFQSSSEGRRGFCHDCGTPLTYYFNFQPRIAVAIASFDRHSELHPVTQFGLESYEPWLAEAVGLPGTRTGEGASSVEFPPERLEAIRRSSRQHPDHNTEDWPPPKP
jgi:hypothetical protein